MTLSRTRRMTFHYDNCSEKNPSHTLKVVSKHNVGISTQFVNKIIKKKYMNMKLNITFGTNQCVCVTKLIYIKNLG